MGAAAKPLLPALRTAAGSKDADFAKACKQVIESIEKSKDEVPEAEAKKRAAIRKEIRELLAGRK